MNQITSAISVLGLLAASASAGIVGSNYTFSTSATGTTTAAITSSIGASPLRFCIGPAVNQCGSSGMGGEILFSDITAQLSQIRFNFSGATLSASGSFQLSFSNLANPGTRITGITLNSTNIRPDVDFGFGATWDGTTAIFTGTPGTLFRDYYAASGRFATFDVALERQSAVVPEPSTYAQLGAALVALTAIRRRWKR